MVHHIHYVIYIMDMISFHFKKNIQFSKIGNITKILLLTKGQLTYFPHKILLNHS